MPRYVAFLRAINVGGHVVKMDTLCALFTAMKFTGVESFLASGNVVIQSKTADDAALAARIETKLREALGYEVSTFVRGDAEVAAIAAEIPFSPAAMQTATSFCVAMLSQPLDRQSEQRLLELSTEDDAFQVRGREFYWLSRKKQSEAVISNAVLERALGFRMTLRGMNTMRRLAAKYPCGIEK